MNLWPVEYVCLPFFSRSALIWKKNRGQKCSTGQRFIFTEVTFYKIHILERLGFSLYLYCFRFETKLKQLLSQWKWISHHSTPLFYQNIHVEDIFSAHILPCCNIKWHSRIFQQKTPLFTALRWNIKDNFCLVISIRTPLFLNKIFLHTNTLSLVLSNHSFHISYFRNSLPKQRSELQWASLTLPTMW